MKTKPVTSDEFRAVFQLKCEKQKHHTAIQVILNTTTGLEWPYIWSQIDQDHWNIFCLSSAFTDKDTSCQSNTRECTYVPQLCLSVCVCFHLSGCWKVCHITIEMRGANGGSCRHDTPAQNFLLLQEETEDSFSISSSLFFPPPLPWNVSLSSSFFPLSLSLYNCPWCLYFLSLSYIPATLQLLPKWPMTSQVSLHVLETKKTLTPKRAQLDMRMLLLFTPLRLHRATHGCRGRRSTPPQHDGAPLMMPSERVATHKPTQHLWSPAGPWSSSGSTQTRDLRRQRGGSQMKTFLSYYLLLTSHIAQYSLVISVLYEGKRQMRLFTKDNHPTREG